MLEALLFTYQNQFGEAFPLEEVEGIREIDLINMIYYCLQSNQKYIPGMKVENRVFGAPGQR